MTITLASFKVFYGVSVCVCVSRVRARAVTQSIRPSICLPVPCTCDERATMSCFRKNYQFMSVINLCFSCLQSFIQ